MKKKERPQNDQPCARERCDHPFGLHFVTHDGQHAGCSWTMDDQRDGFQCCQCDGYLIAYRYPEMETAE